jgi:hypothetical protein
MQQASYTKKYRNLSPKNVADATLDPVITKPSHTLLVQTVSRIKRFTKSIKDKEYISEKQKLWWIGLRENSIKKLHVIIKRRKKNKQRRYE